MTNDTERQGGGASKYSHYLRKPIAMKEYNLIDFKRVVCKYFSISILVAVYGKGVYNQKMILKPQ